MRAIGICDQVLGEEPLETLPNRLHANPEPPRESLGLRLTKALQLEQDRVTRRLHPAPHSRVNITTINLFKLRALSTANFRSVVAAWRMEQPLLEWRGTCDEAIFYGTALRHYSETRCPQMALHRAAAR